MDTEHNARTPRILVLASLSGGYAGADAVGQVRAGYPPNVYILPIVSAAMFAEDFYLRAFERGIDAIIVMYSGTDCPFRGASERAAAIIDRVYIRMKERGLDTRRLRLVAICTVCMKPFLKAVSEMNAILQDIGPVGREPSTGRSAATATVTGQQVEGESDD
jgi:F420-non-reducing hydrogenase iron-sulfur subunit